MTQTATLSTGMETASLSVSAMETAMASYGRMTLNDLLTQQEALIKQSQETAQLEDTVERAKRLEIIEASMETLSARISAFREDTAELIAGLEAQFEKIGIDMEQMQKPTTEDLKIVQRAEGHLRQTEASGPAHRAELEGELKSAQSSWNPFGKQVRIAAAEEKLTRFDIEHAETLATAHTAVEEAKAEVERLRRKRIREADFDAQFHRFIGMAKQIQETLLKNVADSEARMAVTQKALAEAHATKEDLSVKLAELDDQVRHLEDDVLALEREISQTTDQTARTTVERQLAEARQQLADAGGTKQEMQVAFNALEAAAVKHATMLQALQVQRDNQRSHARKLQVDSTARFQQAQNLVTVIKNTTQEDAASRLHGVGSFHGTVFFFKTIWFFTLRYVQVVNEYTARPEGETRRPWARYRAFRWPMRLFLWMFVPIVTCIVPIGVAASVFGILVFLDQITKPDFTVDPGFVRLTISGEGQTAGIQDIGATLMQASHHQLERELDSLLGWTVNDVTGLRFWDNRVNRQLGVRHASLELLGALSVAISKFGSADEENQMLVRARQNHLAISPESWFLPAAENEYRDGIELIKQYQMDIRKQVAHATINITNTDIEAILRVIDTRVLEVPHGRLNARNFEVSWSDLDDRVFFAQGAAIVARDALYAIRAAFSDKITAAGALENMHLAIAALEGSIHFHPWVIARGDGDSMWADHRAKMSRYFTDARRRIGDVADAIQR